MKQKGFNIFSEQMLAYLAECKVMHDMQKLSVMTSAQALQASLLIGQTAVTHDPHGNIVSANINGVVIAEQGNVKLDLAGIGRVDLEQVTIVCCCGQDLNL